MIYHSSGSSGFCSLLNPHVFLWGSGSKMVFEMEWCWACYREDAVCGPWMRTCRRTNVSSGHIVNAFVVVWLVLGSVALYLYLRETLLFITRHILPDVKFCEKTTLFWRGFTYTRGFQILQNTVLIISAFFICVWAVGGDVCSFPTAASEEPGELRMHHQRFTHSQLQKWNTANICKHTLIRGSICSLSVFFFRAVLRWRVSCVSTCMWCNVWLFVHLQFIAY